MERTEASRLIDQWFVGRGLPSLAPHRRDPAAVWRRALPAMVVWYAAVVSPTAWFDPSRFWPQTLAGLAAFVVAWLASNLRQRQRPFSVPRSVTWFELTLFAVAPLVPILFDTELDTLIDDPEVGSRTAVVVLVAVVVVLAQLLGLVVIRAAIRYGALALTVWMFKELASSVVAVSSALARTLPLLLGVVTFFFFTAEVWQSIGRLHPVSYTLLILLFVSLGAAFLNSRHRLDVDALATFDSRPDLERALIESPGLSAPEAMTFPARCRLSPRQRANLRLVAVLSRMVVAVVVALAVGMVFLAIGWLSIDAEIVKAWTLHPPKTIAVLDLGSGEWLMSWQHIKVAGFLATFSGFYFSVVSATDAEMRAGMRDTAEDAVRDACAVRLVATWPQTAAGTESADGSVSGASVSGASVSGEAAAD